MVSMEEGGIDGLEKAMGSKDADVKVMKELSDEQKQTKVKSALLEAKKAVIASKHAAEEAMLLAKTPAQKEDAQEQAAVAKRLFEAYTKQVARLALSPSGGSAATFAQLESAAIKPSFDAAPTKNAAGTYKSSSDAAPAYASAAAPVVAAAPVPSGMLSPEEVEAKVKNAVEMANAAATAKFVTAVQSLDTQWQGKMAAAVSAAVQGEKKKAEDVLSAQKESAMKKLAIEASARKLAENKANLQIEKLKLEELGRASAAAALTAGLQAKAEAKTINAQANILAAESTRDAAESTVTAPASRNQTGSNSSAYASGFSPKPSASYSSTKSEPKNTQLAEAPSLDDLTSAVKKLSEAQVASKMAAATHRETEQAASKQDLLATYNAAKEELEASASNEKTSKLDAQKTFKITFTTAEGKVKSQNNRALALSGKMKEEADKAVATSKRAVEAASARTQEAFVKNAHKTAAAQSAGGATPALTAADKEAAAAVAGAKAKATVAAAKMQAAAASTMAYNLQNHAIKQREKDYKTSQKVFLKQQTSEAIGKDAAKQKAEAAVAAAPPVS